MWVVCGTQASDLASNSICPFPLSDCGFSFFPQTPLKVWNVVHGLGSVEFEPGRVGVRV